MATTETKMRRLDLPLPGGRMLRLALVLDDDGSPLDVCIGAGFASDPALKALVEGVSLPASALPSLRDALAQLDGAA